MTQKKTRQEAKHKVAQKHLREQIRQKLLMDIGKLTDMVNNFNEVEASLMKHALVVLSARRGVWGKKTKEDMRKLEGALEKFDSDVLPTFMDIVDARIARLRAGKPKPTFKGWVKNRFKKKKT